MAEESVETPEDNGCRACEGGWGHEVDMTDGYDCKFRCRVCREVHVIDARSDTDCCDHRYVGEDLWRAEQATDSWACPECGGSYGEHEMHCDFFVCDDCGGHAGVHDDDCDIHVCDACGLKYGEHTNDCEVVSG
jgi:hypothetical protein